MKHVVVHIDRLVLKGFRLEDRHDVALGLQEELGSVFGDRGAVEHLSAMGNLSRLQVGSVRIEHGSKSQLVGGKVARGISKEIGK